MTFSFEGSTLACENSRRRSRWAGLLFNAVMYPENSQILQLMIFVSSRFHAIIHSTTLMVPILWVWCLHRNNLSTRHIIFIKVVTVLKAFYCSLKWPCRVFVVFHQECLKCTISINTLYAFMPCTSPSILARSTNQPLLTKPFHVWQTSDKWRPAKTTQQTLAVDERPHTTSTFLGVVKRSGSYFSGRRPVNSRKHIRSNHY